MYKRLIGLCLMAPMVASAHVGTENAYQHAIEHLLLAAVLIPVVWLAVRKLIKMKSQ